jgi:hypothetical protein
MWRLAPSADQVPRAALGPQRIVATIRPSMD